VSGGIVTDYFLSEATTFSIDGVDEVSVSDAPASVSRAGAIVRFDRLDPDFSVRAAGVADVRFRDQHIPTVEVAGYLLPSIVSSAREGTPTAPGLAVRAYPNPFNPTVRIDVRVSRARIVTAEVFDIRGRRVARLWNGRLSAGVHALRWDGTRDAGGTVPSGVYFLRVASGAETRTTKLTILK
jgi:hypothetical protein